MITALQMTDSFSSQPMHFNPLKWLADTIESIAKKIFGYIMRVSVFQLGEYQKRFAYLIMRLYQRSTSDPREASPVDRDRLERSKEYLIEIGGIPSVLRPADGGAKLHCMTFTARRFFKRIAEMGGEKRAIRLNNGERRFAILPKEGADPKSYAYLTHLLAKFFFRSISVQVGDTIQKGVLLPVAATPLPGQKLPLILECLSPGRCSGMNRGPNGFFLAAGYDYMVFDKRGTIYCSSGTPSEGGYRLDVDAAVQLAQSLGYKKICIFGLCHGGGFGVSALQKYRNMSFVVENPYNSLRDMARHQSIFGRMFTDFALDAVKTTDPAIVNALDFPQNGFDMAATLRSLPPNQVETICFAFTKGDSIVPPQAREELEQAIAGKCRTYVPFVRTPPPGERHSHQKRPIDYEEFRRRFVEIIR